MSQFCSVRVSQPLVTWGWLRPALQVSHAACANGFVWSQPGAGRAWSLGTGSVNVAVLLPGPAQD